MPSKTALQWGDSNTAGSRSRRRQPTSVIARSPLSRCRYDNKTGSRPGLLRNGARVALRRTTFSGSGAQPTRLEVLQMYYSRESVMARFATARLSTRRPRRLLTAAQEQDPGGGAHVSSPGRLPPRPQDAPDANGCLTQLQSDASAAVALCPVASSRARVVRV